jgi:hypothetical protein
MASTRVRRFADDEPGCWTDYRGEEFPELCHCDLRRGRGHTNCKAWGPYCLEWAPQVEARLLERREMYRD